MQGSWDDAPVASFNLVRYEETDAVAVLDARVAWTLVVPNEFDVDMATVEAFVAVQGGPKPIVDPTATVVIFQGQLADGTVFPIRHEQLYDPSSDGYVLAVLLRTRDLMDKLSYFGSGEVPEAMGHILGTAIDLQRMPLVGRVIATERHSAPRPPRSSATHARACDEGTSLGCLASAWPARLEWDGTRSSSELCPPVSVTDLASAGWPLRNDSRLHVRVCEGRDAKRGGILLVEGLIDPDIADMIKPEGEPCGADCMRAMQLLDDEIVDFLGRSTVLPHLEPWPRASIRNHGAEARVTSLHHDRNHKPLHYATVLTYLDEGSADHDGHTLFPTIVPRGSQRTDVQRSLLQHLEVFAPDLEDTVRSRKISIPANKKSGAFATSVLANVTAMCERIVEADGASKPLPYLAIPRRRGVSLVIWHMVRGADGLIPELGDHWHTGCPHRAQKRFHLRFATVRKELLSAGSL